MQPNRGPDKSQEEVRREKLEQSLAKNRQTELYVICVCVDVCIRLYMYVSHPAREFPVFAFVPSFE